MVVYFLIVSLVFGVIGFVAAIIEVKVVYKFMTSNQKIKNVPKISSEDKRNTVNKHIREFRKLVWSSKL